MVSGESNRGKFEVYKELFPSLIYSWRQEWKNKTLPFYYVQLAQWDQMKIQGRTQSMQNLETFNGSSC